MCVRTRLGISTAGCVYVAFAHTHQRFPTGHSCLPAMGARRQRQGIAEPVVVVEFHKNHAAKFDPNFFSSCDCCAADAPPQL